MPAITPAPAIPPIPPATPFLPSASDRTPASSMRWTTLNGQKVYSTFVPNSKTPAGETRSLADAQGIVDSMGGLHRYRPRERMICPGWYDSHPPFPPSAKKTVASAIASAANRPTGVLETTRASLCQKLDALKKNIASRFLTPENPLKQKVHTRDKEL
jgi:hypothetical protein